VFIVGADAEKRPCNSAPQAPQGEQAGAQLPRYLSLSLTVTGGDARRRLFVFVIITARSSCSKASLIPGVPALLHDTESHRPHLNLMLRQSNLEERPLVRQLRQRHGSACVQTRLLLWKPLWLRCKLPLTQTSAGRAHQSRVPPRVLHSNLLQYILQPNGLELSSRALAKACWRCNLTSSSCDRVCQRSQCT